MAPSSAQPAHILDGWRRTVESSWEKLWQSSAAASPAAVEPVVIVGGLFSPSAAYEVLADRLRAQGRQVYIFQLPTLGTQDVAKSAEALGAFVDQIRAQTGADKVDLVGHSEGGVVAREYIKVNGGVDHVEDLVTLGSPHHGTLFGTAVDIVTGPFTPPAARELSPGSQFLADLNAGDETPGAVHYTTFRTAADEAVRPLGSAMLDGADNILVQNQVPLDPVGHVGLVFDPFVAKGVAQALREQPVNMTD